LFLQSSGSSLVLVGLRRGRIDSEQMTVVLDRIDRAAITLDPIPGAYALFTHAQRHRLAFYAAAYFERALREAAQLAILDRALARAARAEGVVLLGA
jgi:predicted nucleic acid-binding protein